MDAPGGTGETGPAAGGTERGGEGDRDGAARPDGGGRTDTGSMRDRASKNRTALYVLLEADRWLVTAGILLFVFGVLVAVGTLGPVSLAQFAEQANPLSTLFQALTGAIITGVSIVVTITQLVLSQELGPAGDQRERMEGAMSFRSDAADLIDPPVSPLEPATFLAAVLRATRSRTVAFADASSGLDEPLRSRIETFTESVTADADLAIEELEMAQFGTYEVLSAALDFNYSVKLYDARRFDSQHGSALSEEAAEALSELRALLSLYAPAREHVKTLYFQWELSNLTREILFVTVPALVVAIASVLYLDAAGAIVGTTLGVQNVVWVASAAATVSVAPFALFIAYVLRVTTVAKHTLAIGPFVLRSLDESRGVQWDDRD